MNWKGIIRNALLLPGGLLLQDVEGDIQFSYGKTVTAEQWREENNIPPDGTRFYMVQTDASEEGRLLGGEAVISLIKVADHRSKHESLKGIPLPAYLLVIRHKGEWLIKRVVTREEIEAEDTPFSAWCDITQGLDWKGFMILAPALGESLEGVILHTEDEPKHEAFVPAENGMEPHWSELALWPGSWDQGYQMIGANLRLFIKADGGFKGFWTKHMFDIRQGSASEDFEAFIKAYGKARASIVAENAYKDLVGKGLWTRAISTGIIDVAEKHGIPYKPGISA